MKHDAGALSIRERLDDVVRGEWRICLIGLGISLCVFQTGFDSVATAGFQGMRGFLIVFGYKDPTNPLGYNLSTRVQTLIQSLMIMGSLFANALVFLVGSRVSRRTAIWAGCVLSLIAVSVQIASTSLAALYIGRLLLGISNGLLTAYTSIFIAEIAPSFLRGSLLASSIFVSNSGGLVGVIVNNFTQRRLDRLSYQIPMAIMYIPPIVIGIFLFFLPDTPRYYIIIGEYDKATNAIRRLRGNIDGDKLGDEIEQMKASHLAEQELRGKTHVLDIFKGTDLRRTLLVYAVCLANIVTGRSFLAQYSVYFLAQARISNPFLWVMITYIISLTGNIFGSILMRYSYRKTILNLGLAGMAVCMFVMAISNSVLGVRVSAGRLLVSMYIIHTWIGSAATMPSAACLTAELASQRLRPEMMGTSSLILWGASWLISYTTPYFINPEQLNWGPKYAYIWGASCLTLMVWAWIYIPETMGRSLEQIDELFRKKVPSRKFRTFVVENVNVDDKYEQRENSSKEDDIREQSVTRIAEPIVEVKH